LEAEDPPQPKNASQVEKSVRLASLQVPLAPTPLPQHSLLAPVPEPHTLRLTATDVAQQAAANAPLAEIFRLEKAMNARLEQRGHSEDKSGPTLRRLLDYRAEMARQAAAKQALELFFALYEADEQLAVLDETRQLLEESAEAQRAITRSGTDTELDPFEVPLQELELQSQRAALESNRRQANAALLSLLGHGAASHQWIVPVLETHLVSDIEPLEQAIATGMAERVELKMHRLVLCQPADAALPAMAQTLQYADPSLGIAPFHSTGLSFISLIFHNRDRQQTETTHRRRQIEQLRRETTEAITAEIVSAHQAVTHQWEQIRIATTTYERQDERVRFYEQRRDTGKFDYAALQASRADRLQARSNLVRETNGFRRARVVLSAAQGTPFALVPLLDGT
jgi:outer membrane protein TolC